MSLSPAYDNQSTTVLPLAFGLVSGVGQQVFFTTLSNGNQVGFYVLGDGEWDGMNSMRLYQGGPLDPANTFSVHFHPGAWSVLGSGTTAHTSTGQDQGYDNLLDLLPTLYPRLAFSGMAYVAILFQLPTGVTPAPTLAPIGHYRALRCRIFDAYGNVVSYGFTLNPAWHFVEATLRYKIKPQQPRTAGLSDAEKACFDWPSIVQVAARNDFVLANGKPRFQGSYVFASTATLTTVQETILRSMRAFQRTWGGKIYLIGDDPRPSVFVLSSRNYVPGTLLIDKKLTRTTANKIIGKFRDINVPAIVHVLTASCASNVLTINSDGNHPFATGDRLVYGGGATGVMDGTFAVTSTTATVVTCSAPTLANSSDTGGYLGSPQSRFAPRAPVVEHGAHQLAIGQQGIGLARQKRALKVELDFGNNSFDQVNRLCKFQRDNDLGPDPMASGRLRGLWTAGVSYFGGDIVTDNASYYIATVPGSAGFESNSVGSPLNTALAVNQAVGDGWNLVANDGGALYSVQLESGGISHNGTNNLLLRVVPNQVIPATGQYGCRVLGTTQIPVTPGTALTYSCYKGWWAIAAVPAGIQILHRLGVWFYNASGTFVSEDYVDVANTVTNAYGLVTRTVTAPAAAAYAVIQMAAFLHNTTGADITLPSGLIADLRFDDVTPIPLASLVPHLSPGAWSLLPPWVAAKTMQINVFLEAIDDRNQPAIGVENGDVITIDDTVTPEHAGDYQLVETTPYAPAADQPESGQSASHALTPSTSGSQIQWRLRTYSSTAYTDTADAADTSYLTVPDSALPMGSGPNTNACEVLARQIVITDNGSGFLVTVTGLVAQIMGAAAPSSYGVGAIVVPYDITSWVYVDDPTSAGGALVMGSYNISSPPTIPFGRVLIVLVHGAPPPGQPPPGPRGNNPPIGPPPPGPPRPIGY